MSRSSSSRSAEPEEDLDSDCHQEMWRRKIGKKGEKLRGGFGRACYNEAWKMGTGGRLTLLGQTVMQRPGGTEGDAQGVSVSLALSEWSMVAAREAYHGRDTLYCHIVDTAFRWRRRDERRERLKA